MSEPTKPESIEKFINEISNNKKPSHTSIFVDENSGTIEIMLDDCPCHAEWIQGEGGDICLYRHMDSNRLVGARLPLIYSTLIIQHQSKTP